METLNENYWSSRYENAQTGWDIGYVSTPLKAYFDQIDNKELKILIPGAGNGYEAEYLHQQGFKNVFVVDISDAPLKNLQARVPTFPKAHLLHADFFELSEHTFDLIVEQTFFCALNPLLRQAYAHKMLQLLNPKGKLMGLMFNAPLNTDHPPFGGNKEAYLPFFKDFKIKYFEPCHNSIAPRMGKELFVCLEKHA